MAYEEDLAHRVRELIGDEPGLSEMRMFGGLAFLLDGNMAVAVSSKGGLMLRHDPGERDELLARAHTRRCSCAAVPPKDGCASIPTASRPSAS